MGILKKTWKLLTEYPSKDISKSTTSKVTLQPVETTIETKPKVAKSETKKEHEVKEPTLVEILYNLKSSTYLSKDFSIKSIDPHYKYWWYDGYDYTGLGHGRYKSRRNQEPQYDITIEISGRSIFERLVPQFGSMSERDYSGFFRFNNKNVIVKKILIVIRLEEEPTKMGKFYRGELRNISVVRTSVGDEVEMNGSPRITSKTISVGHLHESRHSNIQDVLHSFTSIIKDKIEREYEIDLDDYSKKLELININNEFNKSINEDSLQDLFSYIGDYISPENLSIQKVKSEYKYNYAIPGLGSYWAVCLCVNSYRTGNEYHINGSEFANILSELGETLNRIKDIHNCNITTSFGDNIIVSVKPIYPSWLNEIKPNTRQSRGRFDRRCYYDEYDEYVF